MASRSPTRVPGADEFADHVSVRSRARPPIVLIAEEQRQGALEVSRSKMTDEFRHQARRDRRGDRGCRRSRAIAGRRAPAAGADRRDGGRLASGETGAAGSQQARLAQHVVLERLDGSGMDEFHLSEHALGCQRGGPHVLVRLQDAVEHVGGVEGAAFGTCGVRQDRRASMTASRRGGSSSSRHRAV